MQVGEGKTSTFSKESSTHARCSENGARVGVASPFVGTNGEALAKAGVSVGEVERGTHKNERARSGRRLPHDTQTRRRKWDGDDMPHAREGGFASREEKSMGASRGPEMCDSRAEPIMDCVACPLLLPSSGSLHPHSD